MLCDGLGFWFVTVGVSIGAQLFIGYVLHDRQTMTDGVVSGFIGTASAVGLWLVVILATGQSIGDFAVQLRYGGSPMPQPLPRLLRWLGGIAGLSAIGLLGGFFDLISSVAILVAVVMLFFTRDGRGLPGILSGQQLRDAREPR
jgi:hypothetical protein